MGKAIRGTPVYFPLTDGGPACYHNLNRRNSGANLLQRQVGRLAGWHGNVLSISYQSLLKGFFMGDYQLFERFVWFHREVQKKKYPNAAGLAENFGLSGRSARRNIEYMRHYLGAPLVYDAEKKGYTYAESDFQLPYLHATQEELLAIILSRNLLSHTAGGHISRALKSFGKKLSAAAADLGLAENRLDEAFSATWNGYSPTQADTFQKTADALLQDRLLHFSYVSPRDNSSTVRTVEPHHLQHYMGSWVLLGWCRLRFDWRKFYLSRMSDIRISDKTFPARPIQEWRHQIDGAFGIFQNHEKQEIVLRFSALRARWIKEQVWHPQQETTQNEDGTLLLTMPVADFREIKLRILQYGSDVEVVSPEVLRRELAAEIKKMAVLYA
jgi:predicted DNA-binding transcriptional regulator YafY